MAAINVALSSFELDRFAWILRDQQMEPSSFVVACLRFTPTFGPITEVVEIEGPAFGRYDRGPTWLDEFQRDVAARHTPSNQTSLSSRVLRALGRKQTCGVD